MIWLFYILFELFIWSAPFREWIVGGQPIIHMAASFLNDLIWLPLAVALPFHSIILARKVMERLLVREIILGLFALIVLFSLVSFDVFFRFQFLFILIYVLLWGVYIFQYRTISIRLIFFTMALAGMVFHYNSQLLPGMKAANVGRRLSVMSFNFNSKAAMDDERTAAFIRSIVPDVLCLQEFGNREMRRVLSRLADLYPYSQRPKVGGGARDVMILSRFPIIAGEEFRLEMTHKTEEQYSNHAVIDWHGVHVHVINCHLTHSVRHLAKALSASDTSEQHLEKMQRAFMDQRDQARSVAKYANALAGPVIIAGDFNDTANSYVYRQFADNYQNAFARRGWGLGATFGRHTLQQRLPRLLQGLAFNYLRIDHIFCSKEFRVIKAKVLPLAAFDHRPHMAVLVLKK